MNDILSLLHTKQEADNLTAGIDSLLSSLYKKDVDVKMLISKTIPASVSGSILDDLAKQNVALQNLEIIQTYFEDLKTKTESLKIFSLTIPFQPTYSFVKTLHQWVIENLPADRQGVGQGIVLNLQIDPTLRAGSIVEYEGIYRDYSIKKQLEEVFMNKKEEVLKSL